MYVEASEPVVHGNLLNWSVYRSAGGMDHVTHYSRCLKCGAQTTDDDTWTTEEWNAHSSETCERLEGIALDLVMGLTHLFGWYLDYVWDFDDTGHEHIQWRHEQYVPVIDLDLDPF